MNVAELLTAVRDGESWAFLEVAQECHPDAGVRISMGGLDSTRNIWVLLCHECGECIAHIAPCPAPEHVRWKQDLITNQMIMDRDGTIRRVGQKRVIHPKGEQDAESSN